MSAKDNKKKSFPAWHPNFRIAEELPDIKAVRTDFLINIGSALLALVLLFWIVNREATIRNLDLELSALQAEEQRLSPENSRAIGLNRKFLQNKQILDDLEKFFDIPVDIPGFLADIAEIRPADISFAEIAYQEIEQKSKEGLTRSYRIFLRGQTRQLNEIDLLKDALIDLPYLSDVDATITEGSNPRNSELNTFGFSVEVRFEPNQEG